MKTYIITESQINKLKNASVVGDALLNSLKPIEPISEKVAWDIAADHFNDEAPYEPVIAYALAIERHILGGTP